MNVAYSLGCAAIRLALRVKPLAHGLTAFSRIWARHAAIQRHLRAGGYDGVIDGGANIGEFAGLVRMALPDADLVCVEPHPGCAEKLRRHGYRVVEAALWRERARVTLRQPSHAETSCSVLPDTQSSRGEWEVPAIPLSEIQIQGRHLLIKLDLQGAEIEALAGMGILWQRCEALLLEVSLGQSGTYRKLAKLLETNGFLEYATLNELEIGGRVVEADKLWRRVEGAEGN